MEGSDTTYVTNFLNDSQTGPVDPVYKDTLNFNDPQIISQEIKLNTSDSDKHSANWTTSATSILLKLYEGKIEMLETPKKKTAMWLAISNSLKDYNIEMTPNQVRWKINALTQKYKQCIENGQQNSFKYFREMDTIYSRYYNEDNDLFPVPETLSGPFRRKKSNELTSIRFIPESKTMIELRKLRLANRIDSDRNQSKLQIEKQWLEYLRRQEEEKILKDEIFERTLKMREEALELRKKELDLKKSLEYRKMQLKEKQQEDFLRIEREKCEILQYILQRRRGLN